MTTRTRTVRKSDWKLQQLVTDIYPRCWRCNKLLGEELTRPWRIECQRCHAMHNSQPIERIKPDTSPPAT